MAKFKIGDLITNERYNSNAWEGDILSIGKIIEIEPWVAFDNTVYKVEYHKHLIPVFLHPSHFRRNYGEWAEETVIRYESEPFINSLADIMEKSWSYIAKHLLISR